MDRLARGGAAAVLMCVAGCGGQGSAPGGEPSETPSLSVAPTPVTVEPGGERLEQCQTFALENAGPLFVSSVTLTSTPGIHHSDWFVVPEDDIPGPAHSADCAEFTPGFAPGDPGRGYGYVFGQSTQSLSETQSFGENAAFVVPARAKLYVRYHLVNTSTRPLDIAVTAKLLLTDASKVKIRLRIGGGLLGLLALPPLSRSRFYSECTFAEPPAFKGYFFVPHYHRLGTGMWLELAGGPRDGEVVWSNTGPIGEAAGSRFPAPVDFEGATGFRFGCVYDNTTADTVVGGAPAENEMCVFHMQADWDRAFYGITAPGWGDPRLVDLGVNEAGERVFSAEGCSLLVE